MNSPQFPKDITIKRLNDAQINDIIARYQNGETPLQIAHHFGIMNNSVTRILRKQGIERDQQIRVSQDKIDQIIQEYNSGVSSEVIATKLKINGTTVCRILKRNNIKIRPTTENKRRYKIAENYFTTIDTEEKAYFLGFLYADGSLSATGNGIKISLHEKDRDILERFSIIIYGFIKLSEETRELDNGVIRKYLTVAFYSKKMHTDLIALGCPPAKTFTIRLPKNHIVPRHLLRHFVRGYFDGDGCICITNPARPRIDFSSNALFIQNLIVYLEDQGIRCNKMGLNKENPLSGSVELGCPDNVINAYHLMYDDATIYMQRKYNTFQEMFRLLEAHRQSKLDKNINM